MGYSYKLFKNKKEVTSNGRYRENELRKMTTFQLREICSKEKLVSNTLNPLDKEELVRLIMRYRGIDENLFINKHDENGLKKLQGFLTKVNKITLNDKIINFPSKLLLYEGLSIEIFDNYLVTAKDIIEEGNVILIDGSYNICTIFNLTKFNEKYYLIKNENVKAKETTSKNYSLLYFDKKQSELIYDIYYHNTKHIPQHLKFYSFPVLDYSIREPIDTDTPLAIDFGTTNTTAGIYINKESFDFFHEMQQDKDQNKDKISVVKVLNTTLAPIEITPLIPSVVGIKSIEDDDIEYVFGYDAIKLSKLSYEDDGICIFYDIKRWISDYEREEKITDTRGQKTYIKRKHMIKAFLEYVIHLAKQRFKVNFKKIHISCPSKQKYKFYKMFEEILAEYKIEYENMLDEGASVLFNTITELIENKSYIEGQYYKALIIDCGGGTTDLSSCEFKIENNRVSYKIDIETSYENGDTDFGGNNLTFRIMQLIKIIFAHKLNSNDNIKARLLEEFDVDLFRYVDKHGGLEIYKKLDYEYNQVEEIIPTKFKQYENKSSDEYFKVKSNFFLLFELAEEVKKQFFHDNNSLEILITPHNEASKDKTTIDYDKWRIHTYSGKFLEQLKNPPEITLSIFDITTLIKADIYNIIKKFLESIYRQDKLLEYSVIKLTGQSCKIDAFREAIKEFVPGRVIQSRKDKKAIGHSYGLKLDCLRGALKHLQAKNLGYMDINIQTKLPILPYVISAFTHSGEEKILIHSLDKNNISGTISRFMERITLKLYLKDTNGALRYEYAYENKQEDFKETIFEEIEEKYKGLIIQDETDNIVNKEVKFFVWAKKEEWGFCVVPVLRNNEKLFIGKEGFFNFENDIWETNFFDGLK
ncbi:hypothetical protein SAMN05446037_100512 [Anaerovirgula multivorans]|uniref:Molecular chaperone n=1 Tax=Anaerovirgula multivorans TaxID=312168 RepID=A0A239C4T2_9FIRM|nr:molecular chaperone [Anaerovirgula multivorans]SNS15265.1 hypothetical protein SAMN05446037_100512 [Anaerovirgula multivorans]